jgi:zinc protease
MKFPHSLTSLAIFTAFFCAPLHAEPAYAILTWKQTQSQEAWKGVIEALAKKHKATVIVCDQNLSEALPALQKNHPRNVAVVGTCEQVDGKFINQFHQLMRQIDADPYTDARWGVITGRTAEDAMKIVNEVKPLEIRRTVSGTRIATRMCEDAECFDELVARGHSIKKGNELEKELVLDDADSIAELATAFADPATQLIITSGHATTRDWQPGFRYKNGSFHSRDGVIYGRDLQRKEHPVRNDTPKVYLPCGNCLMGLIDGPDAMALAWMHSVGVRQMAGYVEPTWYGYMGWGLMDYFVEQPGRYTFAEAFIANQLALVHRLETSADLSAMDRKGMLFDRDMVAFYGDPAWSAKMAARPLPFSQKITQTAEGIVIEITPLEGEKSYEPIDTNGSQRGGRPFVAFLPQRIDPKTFATTNDPNAVLGDDFVLIPRPPAGSKSQPIRIEWKVRK